jgi:hypothetical protein
MSTTASTPALQVPKPSQRTGLPTLPLGTCAPGSLRELIAFMPPDPDQAYVHFRDGKAYCNTTPGQGLADKAQVDAFQDAIVAELDLDKPRARSHQYVWGETTRRYARALVERTLAEDGPNVTLKGLRKAFVVLRKVLGKDPAVVNEETRRLADGVKAKAQEAALRNVAGETKSDRGAVAGQPSRPNLRKAAAAVMCAVKMVARGFRLQSGPMTRTELRQLLATDIYDDELRHVDKLMRLVHAVREDPALAADVLEWADRVLSAPADESGADPWAVVTPLVLCLPKAALRALVVTPRQLEKMRAVAFDTLRHMGEIDANGMLHPELLAAYQAGGNGADVKQRVLRQYLVTIEGTIASTCFCEALRILSHNARRFEKLLDLAEADLADATAAPEEEPPPDDASATLQPDATATSTPPTLADVLQEMVPEALESEPPVDLVKEFETAPVSDSAGRTGAETLPAQAPVRPRPHVDAQAGTQVLPEGRKAGASRLVPPIDPDAGRPLSIAPGRGLPQPGAKRPGPGHWHTKGLRRLSRGEVQKRLDVFKAREMHMLGRFGEWSPELAQVLIAGRRETKE